MFQRSRYRQAKGRKKEDAGTPRTAGWIPQGGGRPRLWRFFGDFLIGEKVTLRSKPWLASLSLGCGEERTYKRENGSTGGGKPLANPPYCGIIAAKRLLYRIMIAVFLAPCGATEKTWHNTIPALPSWYYDTTPAALGPRPPPTVPIHPVLTPRESPEGKDDRYRFILARE